MFQYALRAMGMIAVMVNIALIGVSGQLKRVHPDLDPSHHVIYILAIEVSTGHHWRTVLLAVFTL